MKTDYTINPPWPIDWSQPCLQERYSPHSGCFGCGPQNEKGLKIRSFPLKVEKNQNPSESIVVAQWWPKPHHEAFPGVLNGGIIGALLDCHSNWAAAYELMKKNRLSHPPCSVTADFHVKLLRPTPTDQCLYLSAFAPLESIQDDRVLVEAELFIMKDGTRKLTATCRGTFVAVQPGHPAYHRW